MGARKTCCVEKTGAHLDLPGSGWAGQDLLQGVLVGGGRLGQHYLLLIEDQLPACTAPRIKQHPVNLCQA